MSRDGRALLVAVLVTGLTTFMFLPLLAVYLTAQGVPALRTGFLIGLLSFSGQAFSLLVGHLVDRLGPRGVMVAGFAMRIVGYVALALAGGTNFPLLTTGIAAIGLGGTLLGLSIKTQLVSEDGIAPRSMLALRSTFVNVGVVVGPAVGALTYPLGFQAILAACVLSHLVLGVRLVASRSTGVARQAAVGAPEARTPGWSRRHWVVLCGLALAYSAIYSQLNVTLPITATELTGTATAIAVVFTVNGALVVLLQYSMLHHVFGRTSSRTLLMFGFGAFACAYLVLAPLAGWVSLMLFVLPVTVAEMLISPSLDDQAIRAGSRRRTGLALGSLSAAGACGSLLGASAGGLLLDALDGGSGVFLGIAGLSCAAVVLGFLLPKGAADMTQPTVVLLSPREPVIRAVRRRGLAMVVVAEKEDNTPAGAENVLDCQWTVDLDGLVGQLEALNLRGPVSCFGFGEISSRAAAEANARLGWPGNPPASLEMFDDKAALRAAVGAMAGRPVPYERCMTARDVLDAMSRIGFPCLVKPTNGTGSVGVRLLRDPAEARAWAVKLRDRPRLVEEFLEGTEVSVEAMSTPDGHRVIAVTEKATSGPPRFVETGHTVPMGLDPDMAEAIRSAVSATLDAAGHRYGVSHTELMLTAVGPRLIESHGRPGGDRISHMLDLALGEDVYEQTVAATLGLPMPDPPAERAVAGIRFVEFPSDRPAPAVDPAAAAALPGVHEVHLSVTADTYPSYVCRSSDRHGFVVAVAATRAELDATLDTAVAALSPHVDPSTAGRRPRLALQDPCDCLADEEVPSGQPLDHSQRPVPRGA
jgi:MFS family permease